MTYHLKKIYKSTPSRRIASCLVVPLFIILAFAFALITVSIVPKPAGAIIAWIILGWIASSVIIFIRLFLLHLKLALGTTITIEGHSITVEQNGETRIMNRYDVRPIQGYCGYSGQSGSTLWGHLTYWVIEIDGKQFMISSLTISVGNFHRYFDSKIHYHRQFIAKPD